LTRQFGIAGLVVAGIATLGCAPLSTAPLERARAAYQDAIGDPRVAEHAPLALHDAERALRAAERARNEKDMASLAYVVERRVEIARADAEERVAETAAGRLKAERLRTLRRARTEPPRRSPTRPGRPGEN
jgi:hypothetical protein